MATFFRVGRHTINPDHVVRLEHLAGGSVLAHFSIGPSESFRGEEAAALVKALEASRALPTGLVMPEPVKKAEPEKRV